MIKFLKYDFKGSYKTLLGFLFGGIFASTFLQFLLNSARDRLIIMPDILMVITAVVSVITIASVIVGFIIYSVRMFSNELNNDRGYLTLSVPKDLTYMVLSKLLIVFLWCEVYSFIGFYYNLFLMNIMSGTSSVVTFFFDSIYSKGFLIDLLKVITIISIESTLTMAICYMSITLSKITFKNKKLGMLWIPIFIILIILLNYVKSFIGSDIFSSSAVSIMFYHDSYNVTGISQFYKVLAIDVILIAILTFINGRILNKKINI